MRFADEGFMRVASLVLVVAGTALVGCGGATADESGRARAKGGSGGAGASIAAGGSPGMVDAGADDAGTCVMNAETAILGFAPAGADAGPSWGSVSQDVSGSVTSVSARSFEFDSCQPNANCLPAMNTVAIQAPGLDFGNVLHVGNLVHVAFTRVCPINCWSSVVVESVATWAGLTNPHPAASGLYVAAAETTVSPVGAPYTVSKVRLTCHDPWPGPSSCSNPIGAYALAFSDPATGATTNVHMGQTTTFPLRGVPLTVRNLQSFQTGACSDLGHFSHWAAEMLPAL
jgi:hypothetical protein